MGSLTAAFAGVDGPTLVARNTLAFLMSIPLLTVIGLEVYPVFASMAPAQAVVVFGVIGGLSGLVSQTIAANMLERLGRDVNVVEMVPPVIASILASAVVTWMFLPPNPNPVTAWLRARGNLPS